MNQVLILSKSENPKTLLLNLLKVRHFLTLKDIQKEISIPKSVAISILEESVRVNKLKKITFDEHIIKIKLFDTIKLFRQKFS